MKLSPAARAVSAGCSVLEAHFRPRIEAPSEWRHWTTTLFPALFSGPFGPHHVEFWEWAERIRPGRRPRPFVGIWSRGGAKTTNCEGVTTFLGARDMRRYALWIRESQEQADKAVDNLAEMLESPRFADSYPKHSDRAVGKYGSSKGWRRNRLHTAGGFVVDGLGLDTKVRGLKTAEQRPDLIIIDDVDGKFDTPESTKKKLHTITHSILPAGSPDLAVIVVQNLITPNGVVSQLADGRADMLHDRIVSGPHPALIAPTFETSKREDGSIHVRIVSGTPTWEGQGIEQCERMIATFGLRAFLEECQHDVHEREGALWSKDLLDLTRVDEIPEDIVRCGVAVDPSGGGDDIGIIIGGRDRKGHAYIWDDWTTAGARGPLAWGRAAVEAYHQHVAGKVLGEKNFGGDLVQSNIQVAAKELAAEIGGPSSVPYQDVVASRGKEIRADPVASAQEAGRVHIVGHLPALERELTGWVPGESKWSPNRLDAMVMLVTWLLDLKPGGGRKVSGWFPGMQAKNGNGKREHAEATP